MSTAASTTPQELVERGLAAAAALPPAPGAGRAQAAVIVTTTADVNLRWALSGLTTNGSSRSHSVTVVITAPVAGGTAVGTVRRQGVDAAQLPELVAEAAAVAAAGAPAEDAAAFPEPGAEWTAPQADAGQWAAAPADTDAGVLGPVVGALGETLAQARAQQRESFGFALHTVSSSWLGTSTGLRLRHDQPAGTFELTGKSHGRSRSSWAGVATRDFTDVDVLALDEQVSTRLAWQERRIDVAPGRHLTVLPPSAVADLMAYLVWSADARSAHEGRSVFAGPDGGTRVGQRLSDLPLTLSGDPGRDGIQCSPFVATGSTSPLESVFDNGLAVGPVSWLRDGVLGALPTTRHTAGLSGLPLHPAPDNLVLESSTGSGGLAELVAGTDRGLLLTCLWYIREVDPVTLLLTGLTRDGVYVIEGGEVVGAASNFRFNESPVDLLRRVDAVGVAERTLAREVGDYLPRTVTPALRVHDLNMSSASEAS